MDYDKILGVGDLTAIMAQWAEVYELLGMANGKFFAKYPNIHNLHLRMDVLRQDLERRGLWERVSRFTSGDSQSEMVEQPLQLTESQLLPPLE